MKDEAPKEIRLWKIPSTWAWTTMGEIATVIGGGTPRTDDASNFDDGEIAWITPADLSGYSQKKIERGGRNITNKGLNSSGATMMPAGTVLFSSRAPIGYVAIAANPVSTNQGFKSFIPGPAVTSDFLYYYLQFAKPIAREMASGTTFLEISGAKAAQIPAPVAPLPEQDRIVAEIEKQLTRLDAATVALKRVQANLKRYRASVLKAACEGRLVPTEAELARKEGRDYEPADQLLQRILRERRARWESETLAKMLASGKPPSDDRWKQKYKEPVSPEATNLPSLPEGWCWASLDQMSAGPPNSFKAGPFGSSLTKSMYVADGYKVYGQEQVLRGDPYFGDYFINEEKFQELSSCAIAPLDLLISLVGTAGRVLILPNDCQSGIINPRLVKLTIGSPEVFREYIQMAFSSPDIQHRLGLEAHGGTMDILNLGILRGMAIPLCPAPEQTRIMTAVSRSLSVLDNLSSVLQVAVQRTSGFRGSVLQMAFSGRLVPQDPQDEPASVQLERIRAERGAERASSKSRGKEEPAYA